MPGTAASASPGKAWKPRVLTMPQAILQIKQVAEIHGSGAKQLLIRKDISLSPAWVIIPLLGPPSLKLRVLLWIFKCKFCPCSIVAGTSEFLIHDYFFNQFQCHLMCPLSHLPPWVKMLNIPHLGSSSSALFFHVASKSLAWPLRHIVTGAGVLVYLMGASQKAVMVS